MTQPQTSDPGDAPAPGRNPHEDDNAPTPAEQGPRREPFNARRPPADWTTERPAGDWSTARPTPIVDPGTDDDAIRDIEGP